MKLLTIDSREVTGRPGVLLDSGEILDLATAPSSLSQSQWVPRSVVSVIAAGRDGLERVTRLVAAAQLADRQSLRRDGALLPYSGTALMAPVRRPGLLLITDASGSGYMKSPNAAIGSGATVNIPWTNTESLWATPMLALVIGRSIFKADETQAAAAIVGYTLLIDLCGHAPGVADDGVTNGQHLESRQFPGACPIGPVIVTCDEFDSVSGDAVSVQINDVEVGMGSLWPNFGNSGGLLSKLSQRYGFRPGDLVALEPATGDVGTPRKLLPGDRFSVAYHDGLELEVTIA